MSKGAKARFRETDGITKPSLHCYYISALKSTRVQPTAAELLFSGRPDFIRAKCAAKRERGPACYLARSAASVAYFIGIRTRCRAGTVTEAKAKLTTYFPLLFWLFPPLQLPLFYPSLLPSLAPSVDRKGNIRKAAAGASSAESCFVTRRRFFSSVRPSSRSQRRRRREGILCSSGICHEIWHARPAHAPLYLRILPLTLLSQ